MGFIASIQTHLRRLNAGGDNGIEVSAVLDRPQAVCLYDTQEQIYYAIQDVLACLRKLPDQAGYEATWMALGTLPEYPRENTL